MSASNEVDTSLLQLFLQQQKEGASSSTNTTTPALRLYERVTSNGAQGYSALGYWAKFIAQQYIKSTSVVKDWKMPNSSAAAPTPVVFLNEATGREAIRDALLQAGVEVEIWGQRGSSNQWQRMKRGTPGSVGDFESILFENEGAEVQLSSLGAVTVQEAAGGLSVDVGVAFVNQTLRSIHYTQFQDNSQLVHLDAMITQNMIKEVVYPETVSTTIPNAAGNFIRVVESSRGMSARKFPAKDFTVAKSNQDQVVDQLAALLDTPQAALPLPEQPLALSAVAALLKYWGPAASEESNKEAFQLKIVNSKSFLQLNSAAVQALNIVSTGQPEAPTGALPNSIYGLFLNRICTGMGARTMRQWLLQPLNSVEEINERLDMVEAMQESAVLRDSLKSSVFRSCVDMDRLNKKLQRGTASLKDALALKNFTHVIGSCVTILKAYQGRHTKFVADNFLAPMVDIAAHTENLQLLIEASVDNGVGGGRSGGPRMKPEFDDELTELDAQRQETQKKIDAEYSRVLKKYGWDQKTCKLEDHASYGQCLRVSRKEDKQVRDHSKDFVIANTTKDGVRFHTGTLSALNTDYSTVTKQYEKRQLGLKKKLMETIATYLSILDDAKEMIAQLDVFSAWATVALESRLPMVRPTLHESSLNTLNIVNLRHSLVEARSSSDFVSNSVRLDTTHNGLIITGPNMGGKSTYMRSVGVAVVLAQAGCFVPCDSAEISVRDAILCRVGATDYLSRGVSTFMVEMLDASSIIATATSASLVIIDELGRGTSTYDGFGLAWSIAAKLANQTKALLLFATHYHELTKIGQEHGNILNVHVSAKVTGEEEEEKAREEGSSNQGGGSVGSIEFLYKLQEGACGKSFGVHVARIAGIPEEVVEAARRRALELESFEGGSAGSNSATVANKLLSNEDFEYLSSAVEKVNAARAGPREGIAALQAEIKQDARLMAILKGQ